MQAAALTAREKDVLALMAQGYSYAGVGERLGISAHTVASHVKKIYRKLGVHSAGAAVRRAFELGCSADRGNENP